MSQPLSHSPRLSVCLPVSLSPSPVSHLLLSIQVSLSHSPSMILCMSLSLSLPPSMSLCLLPPLSTSPLVPLSILLSLLHVIPHFLHIFHLLSFMSLSLILTSSLSRSFSPPLTIYNSLCISATLHLAPSLLSLPSFLQFSLSLSPYSGHISHPVHVSTLSPSLIQSTSFSIHISFALSPTFHLRISESPSLSPCFALSHLPFSNNQVFLSPTLHLQFSVSHLSLSPHPSLHPHPPPHVHVSLCLHLSSLSV